MDIKNGQAKIRKNVMYVQLSNAFQKFHNANAGSVPRPTPLYVGLGLSESSNLTRRPP